MNLIPGMLTNRCKMYNGTLKPALDSKHPFHVDAYLPHNWNPHNLTMIAYVYMNLHESPKNIIQDIWARNEQRHIFILEHNI
jgi:hypothetical protein